MHLYVLPQSWKAPANAWYMLLSVFLKNIDRNMAGTKNNKWWLFYCCNSAFPKLNSICIDRSEIQDLVIISFMHANTVLMLQPGTIDLSLWFNYIYVSQCLVAPCRVCTVFQPLMGIIYGSWNRWLRASCHLTSHDSSSNSYWKRIPPGVYHNLRHIHSCMHTITILRACIYIKSIPLHDCVFWCS